MNTVPKTARLIRVTRLSTEQYLANVNPGQEYTLSVVARGPKLLSSEIRNTSVVVRKFVDSKLRVCGYLQIKNQMFSTH